MPDPRLTAIIDWIKTRCGGAQGLLVPISGGTDSALCFWLCAQALPEKTHGVYVGEDLRCRAWFEQVGHVELLPLLQPGADTHPEVLRWALFQSRGLERHWRLVGSRNRTEQVLGSYSLASRAALYLPIAGLWKCEVLDLCEQVGVPEEILASSRRADPECGRPVELANIPLAAIDHFARKRLSGSEVAPDGLLNEAQRDYLEAIYQRNRFKTEIPYCGPATPGSL